jgi:Bacterial archaeo-eukaryotic release factor family 3
MQALTTGLTERLTWEELKQVCSSPGPCITILLSSYHPGAQDRSQAVRLKTAIRTAADALAGSTPAEVEGLLRPLHEMASDPGTGGGGPALAIFRSPTVFRRFHLSGPVQDGAAVGERFEVTAVLPFLGGEHDFYILNVGKKDLRLWTYRDGRCHQAPLPDTLPKSVQEAGGFDQPDHMLENRSAAGTSAGAMGGVHFSTSAERELGSERLTQFFKMVDQGLRGMLHGDPLVLAGTESELGIYRRASDYAGLLSEPLAGDLRNLPIEEIERLAYKYARASALREAERTLQEFHEVRGKGRGEQNPERVERAAAEGRVLKLIVAAGAIEGAGGTAAGENLVNAATVYTIRNGGQVFAMPAELMGSAAPTAAILRY